MCENTVFKQRLCYQHYLALPRPLKNSVRSYEDYDYKHKLTADELGWLNAFNNEYYHGDKLNNIHTIHPKKYHKEMFKEEYARRVAVDITKARPITDKYKIVVPSHEDAVIAKIDLEPKPKNKKR